MAAIPASESPDARADAGAMAVGDATDQLRDDVEEEPQNRLRRAVGRVTAPIRKHHRVIIVAAVGAFLPLAALLALVELGVVPATWIAGARVPIVVVMTILIVVAAVAAEEGLPRVTAFSEWKDPKVVGKVVGLAFYAITVVPALMGVFQSGGTDIDTTQLQQTITSQGAQQSQQLTQIQAGVASLAAGPSDPRARITQLTGQWSEQGYIDAIVGRQTQIVSLYLQSGMSATTLHEGASSILFGFQVNESGDPVELIKTFQAQGFQVDQLLTDSYLLQRITNHTFPAMWNSPSAPPGYTGGYESGSFTGSLMLWIVQRAMYAGVTDQDRAAIGYLTSHGSDCKIVLAFLDNLKTQGFGDDGPFTDLYPIFEKCSR
jgi:phosphatidylglycerophosphate synthase